MEQTPIEIFDPILLKRILFTAIGLFSCFMGLWIYKSTINSLGFVVGAGSAAYITFFFLTQTQFVKDLTDLQFMLLFVGIMVIGGVLGTMLARVFEHVIFFVAGGIVTLVMVRLVAGSVTPQDLTSLGSFREAITANPPQCWEALVFLVGGILYVFNIRLILAITTAALGGLLIRWVWLDILYSLHPNAHDLTAAILMAIGALVQTSAFRGRREILPPRFRRTDFDNR